MNVILLTIFVGIVLVGFFVALFCHHASRHPASGREALLPLDDETARPPSKDPRKQS